MADDNSTSKDDPNRNFKLWVAGKAREFAEESDIAHDEKDATLPSSVGNDQVHTEMIATKFYEGAVAKAKQCEHEADPEFTNTREKPKGLKVPPHDLFIAKNENVPSSIVLVGPAGSGKSTVLRRYIHDHPNDFIFPLCGRDFPNEDSTGTSTFDFLFPNKDGISDEDLRNGYEWMKENSGETTFMIDSLDTLPFSLPPAQKIIGEDDSVHPPGLILSSIMARKMFPDSKIISASREHGITEFPEEIRAERVISLVGLTEDSIRKYAAFALKEEGKQFCEEVERKHAGLWSFLATPVFLVFSLLGFINREKDRSLEFMPSTMCGVLVKSLRDLSHSRHGGNDDERNKILGKLEKLSYNGIMRGRVTFVETDLKDVGLSPKEATSWSIFVPWNKKKKSDLLQGRNRLFFCHQCVQELLAVIWILEMDYSEFEAFVNQMLEKPRFSVIRRFLVGLLLNDEVNTFALEQGLVKGIPDKDKKKQILYKFLASVRRSCKKKNDKMDFYVTLSEAGSGVKELIKSDIKSIDLVGFETCQVSDLHAIGSILKYGEDMYEIDLSDCDLTPPKMESLLCGLDLQDQEERIQVDKMRFKKNCELGVGGMTALGKMLKKINPKKLVLDESSPTAEELEKFSAELSIHKIKIPKLHIKDFSDISVGSDMTAALCKLLPHISQRLNLRGWNLQDEGSKAVQETLRQENSKDENYHTDVVHGKKKLECIETKLIEEYIEEVLKMPYLCSDAMREFARTGLHLKSIECDDIRNSNLGNSKNERRSYLLQWQQNTGKATVSKLSRLIKKFCETSKVDD